MDAINPRMQLRDWVKDRKQGGLPNEGALRNRFFDQTIGDIVSMAPDRIMHELRLVPKIGQKSRAVLIAMFSEL